MKKQYIIEQTIENIAENSEDENIDYTTLFDQLNFYYEHPINLNRKEIKFDLEQLMLLDQFQIIPILVSLIIFEKLHRAASTTYRQKKQIILYMDD